MKIFKDKINISIRDVEFSISSSIGVQKIESFESQFKIYTPSFEIQVYKIKKQDFIWGEGKSNTDLYGWACELFKKTDLPEDITLETILINGDFDPANDFSVETGESLDAISIYNKRIKRNLYFGTEDNEAILNRSGFPEYLNYSHDYLPQHNELLNYSLVSSIPKLRKGDSYYIHHLVADSDSFINIDDNEEDISGWFAVDQKKYFYKKK